LSAFFNSKKQFEACSTRKTGNVKREDVKKSVLKLQKQGIKYHS